MDSFLCDDIWHHLIQNSNERSLLLLPILMAQKRKRKLLRKLIIFLVLFVVINEGVKTYFYQVTLKEDALFAQDAAFAAAPDTINFLFMGHSRPLAAVDANALPRSFNYASDGEYNIQTYYKLKYILEKTDKVIGTIVMPAGHGSFQSMKDAYTYRSYYWSKYVDYLEVGNIKDDYSTHAVIWFENIMFLTPATLVVMLMKSMVKQRQIRSRSHSQKWTSDKSRKTPSS